MAFIDGNVAVGYYSLCIVSRYSGTANDADLDDYRALAQFRYLLRRFLHISEEAACEAGLESQQHQVLLGVKGLPPDARPTIGEIAERLQIKHHSAVGLVDRLEQRGLVERERDESDRRHVLVRLTAEGERILQELSRFHRRELRTVAPELVSALNHLMSSRPFAGGNESARSRK